MLDQIHDTIVVQVDMLPRTESTGYTNFVPMLNNWHCPNALPCIIGEHPEKLGIAKSLLCSLRVEPRIQLQSE